MQPSKNQSEEYSEEETARRFEAALHGAREVGHEAMKDIPLKRERRPSAMKIGKRKAKASMKATKEP